MSDARKAKITLHNIMNTCCICLKNDDDGRDIVELNCLHIYHRECIEKWMKDKNICPVCKSNITSMTNINDDYFEFGFFAVIAMLLYG